MSKTVKYIMLVMLSAAVQACIRNDIPYPVVELAITSVSGEGFTCSSSDIDASKRLAVIHLEETTDIGNVVISEVGMTEGASSDVAFPGTFDLRSDLHLTLELYQEYDWTISAEQEITRIFRVEGQIGEAVIDADKHEVRAEVPMGMDLSDIRILEIKLGPEGITSMDVEAGDVLSFETPQTVRVTYHDVVEDWVITIETTDVLASLTSVVPGTRVMWLSGTGVPDTEIGFRYRKEGESGWTDVDDGDVIVTGGMAEAFVGGLEPGTDYQVQLYSGENFSEILGMKTGIEAGLPNSDFEEWATLDVGTLKNVVCPYLSQDAAFWGTGNPGAAILGKVLTDKTEDIRPGSDGKYAVRMESMFAGVLGIGKFAAGNIFTGSYLKTVGMSGLVGFGRPFTERPVALHGWMKYTRGLIDQTGSSSMQPEGSAISAGDPDSGIIYIALGDWTPEEFGVSYDGETVGTQEMPICVDTRDAKTFFDKNSDAVIAYGELILDETVPDWTEFTISLDYAGYDRLDVRPTHIVVICTSSRFGDYFIGSTGSRMWVDDLELLYDKVPQLGSEADLH